MTTVLEEAAAWHEEQARAHESSAAVLARFRVDGSEYHAGMVKIHQHFAKAIREAVAQQPARKIFKRSDVIGPEVRR